MIDTSQTRFIRRSVFKLLMGTVAALLLAAFGGLAVFLSVQTGLSEREHWTMLLIGVAIFAASIAAAFVLARGIISKDRFVLRLAPTGFTDKRYSKMEIPWPAFRKIDAIDSIASSPAMVIVQIDPMVEDRLPINKVPKALKRINNAMGGGIGVATGGLATNLDELNELMVAYATDHGT